MTIGLQEILVKQKARSIALTFSDGLQGCLPIAWLRNHSPAASSTPEISDPDLNILQVKPVGQYAYQIFFSDGHQAGIFRTDHLHALLLQYQSSPI